jgi:predicted nucleic acid-binding protein
VSGANLLGRVGYGEEAAVVERSGKSMMALLEHEALLVAGEVNADGSLPADPKDEMFLACVLDGQADLIESNSQF